MKAKTEKPVVCVNCYHVGAPRYTLQKKEYIIGGYWLRSGVPSKQMLCAGCKEWVDATAVHDIH